MVIDRWRQRLNEKHLFAPDWLQEPDCNFSVGEALDFVGRRQQPLKSAAMAAAS
jgi:hypothetical protein